MTELQNRFYKKSKCLCSRRYGSVR